VSNDDFRAGPGPDAFRPEVRPDEFRAAMSRLAAGVVLVTAHEPALDPEGPGGEDAGMTATAFLSLSLEPPLVLLSVRDGSRMDDVLADQPLWAANVLADTQRHLAGRFAMKGRVSDRLLFRSIPHVRGPLTGAPLVEGALVTLECRTRQRVPAGDHVLVIADVLTVTTSSATAGTGALVSYLGRYRGVE
jgi:flavin reductase (DIM6/NTAB) family NADH-FMN oxidoreductase RutF